MNGLPVKQPMENLRRSPLVLVLQFYNRSGLMLGYTERSRSRSVPEGTSAPQELQSAPKESLQLVFSPLSNPLIIFS